MSSRTTRLTPLLHELEAVMTAAGAPFASYALPGISDEQIDALLASTGLVVPTELREWWRWHHGSAVGYPTPTEPGPEIGPGLWLPFAIPEALADQALWLEDSPAFDGDPGWIPTWLPFAFSEFQHYRLVARLDESSADELCVGMWWVFDVPPEEPVAGSLAEVVDWWLRALREGYVTWDDERGWSRGEYRSEYPPYVD